jgi:hypothetical protein
VNDDIDTTETLPHRPGDNRTPFGCRYVRRDEEIRLGKWLRARARRDQDLRTGVT